MTYIRGVGDSISQPAGLRDSKTAASAIPGLPSAEASTRNAASPPNSRDERAVDSARVSLTSALLWRTIGGSDVRFEKVAALRQAIESGTYTVTPADVAAKMIESCKSS